MLAPILGSQGIFALVSLESSYSIGFRRRMTGYTRSGMSQREVISFFNFLRM